MVGHRWGSHISFWHSIFGSIWQIHYNHLDAAAVSRPHIAHVLHTYCAESDRLSSALTFNVRLKNNNLQTHTTLCPFICRI